MKIIHIFPYSVRLSGGHSNAIKAFIECQLSANLDACGISPISGDSPDGVDINHDRIYEFPFDNATDVLGEIKRLADNQSCIVHIHAIDRFSAELSALAKIHHLKVALTSHGQLNYRNLIHGLKKAVYLALFKSPLRQANGIQVLTERERSRLSWVLPWFRGTISVIPHVIEIDPHTASPKANFQSDGCFHILHLGRIDINNKGLDILLRAFCMMEDDHAHLTFAGPDWSDGRKALEQIAQSLGCLKRIDFPGAVYGDDKEKTIRSADLFVLSSRWEAFSISLVEAMAKGIPVLISNRLNLTPELKSASAAMIVDCNVKSVAAGLRKLAADPDLRQKLAANGLEWVKANTANAAVGSKFREFYSRIENS